NDLTQAIENLQAVVGNVSTTVDDVVGNLLDGIGIGAGNNAGGTDGDIFAGVGLNVMDTGILNLPVDVPLDVVEDLTGDLDLDLALGVNLLGRNEISNAAGDSDITLGDDLDLLGTDVLNNGIDIPLDPVEALVGDIDLDLGAAVNVLG